MAIKEVEAAVVSDLGATKDLAMSRVKIKTKMARIEIRGIRGMRMSEWTDSLRFGLVLHC